MTEAEARRILRVPARCTADELRQCYLDLVKVWHPDRFYGDRQLAAKAEQMLRDINAAYAVLQGSGPGASATSPPTRTGAVPTPPGPRQTPLARRATIVLLAGAMLAGLTFLLTAPRPSVPTRDDGPSDVRLPGAPSVPAPARASDPSADPARPLSGDELLPPRGRGRGTLVVNNLSGRDAVVVLVADGEQRYAVYVRAGEKVQVLSLAPGEYDVLAALGHRWNGARFASDVAFVSRDDPVVVGELTASGGTVRDLAAVTIPRAPESGGFTRRPPFRVGTE